MSSADGTSAAGQEPRNGGLPGRRPDPAAALAAVERTMKVQEVILRAMAKKINWWQAAEILGISERQMRR